MPRLLITCLGALTVTLDGRAITADFDTDKTRALLIYLVRESSRPHPREVLAGILWPDQPDQSSLHNLRQRLSHLRKILGDDTAPVPFLLITRDAVQWNANSDYWLDVEAFDAALAGAYHHYQRRNGLGWLNIRLLKQAMKIYRGPFLDLFYLGGSDLYAEWVSLQREGCGRRAVEALALLADYHEQRAEYALARRAVERLVALAPWEETAQAQLMRLLAVDQQWSAAQNQYAILRRYLQEQLGVEPAPSTIALFNQIRSAATRHIPIPPRPLRTQHNLPDLPTPFVGRETELDQLCAQISNPECRLLTLLGPGGSGKTRLALEAAREQVGIAPDGVYFTALVAVTTAPLILPAIADALGLTFTDQSNPQRQLIDYLRNKHLLLLLDNFEHLLADGESTSLLCEILRQAPGVKWVVTSRERLNLQEECIYALNGMSYPPDGSLGSDSPESYDALALFARRARQVRGDFTLDATTLPAVIRICQLFDGLPLGVELAASSSWDCSCAEILERLNRGFDQVAASASNTPSRHRSLSAAFDVSWQLLSPEQQEIFSQLAVFRGGFEAEAAAGVVGPGYATGGLLSALVNKSLLRRSVLGRYEMHEAIRQFAAERLVARPDLAAVARQRHGQYYAGFLAGQNGSLRGAGQEQALNAIHREIENARCAWEWLVENCCAAEIRRCADSLYQYFNTRSRFGEGIEWFRQATLMLEKLAGEPFALGVCLSRLGALAYRARDQALAQAALTRSQEIFSRMDEPLELALCLVSLGGLQLRQKQFDLALASVHHSLTLYRRAADAWGQTYALYLLGLIKVRMGRFDEAWPSLVESVAISRQLGIQQRLIAPLNLLGDVSCSKGDYDAAEKYFQEGLEISRSLHDRFNQGILLNNLATVYQAKQQYDQEKAVFEASLALCREIGDRDGEATALNGLGEMAVHLEEFEQAVQYSQQALQIAHQVGEMWTVIVCHNNLGEAYCGLGNLAQAAIHIRQALKAAAEIQALDLLARGAVSLGRVYQMSGNFDQAIALLRAALMHSAIEDEPGVKARRWLAEMGASVNVESSDTALELLVAN